VTGQQPFSEWNRLASVSTVSGVLGRHIPDLAPVASGDLPAWFHQLRLPPGWRLAQFDASPTQPARMAVCGPHADGSWDGCETVSVFRFTGTPSEGFVLDTSDRMLRDLGAEAITTYPLRMPTAGWAAAVRSTGYLSAAGQRIWLQYSTYLAGSESPGAGILIEHGIFALSDREASLFDDISELRNSIHDAFVSTVAAATEQNVHASTSRGRGDSPDSKGTKMSIFRAGFFPDFDWGDDVVLVGADRDGMRIFQSAVRSAHEEGAASFELDSIKHYVVRQDGAADIDLRPQTVVWRFDDAKLVEMLNLIEPLVDEEGPGHQYVDDLNSPAQTLVLSVDEYVSGGPFAEFPQGLPVPPPVAPLGPTAVIVEAGRHQAAPQIKSSPPSTSTEHAGNERT
jgi:hypothetical protein